MNPSIYLTIVQMASHAAGAGLELCVANDFLGFPRLLPLPPHTGIRGLDPRPGCAFVKAGPHYTAPVGFELLSS